MHVISGLKYLYSIVTVRLAVSAFYAMEPRWHPWEKALFVTFALLACLVIADMFENSELSVSVLAFVTLATQLVKWLICYILAQYVVMGIESVALRWALSPWDMALLCAALFFMTCALCLPVAVTFGLLWCDCQQPGCIVCSVCRPNLRKAKQAIDPVTSSQAIHRRV